MKTTPVLSTITPQQRTILLTAAVFGLLGLVLGVFGAHGVRDKISADDYRNYEKGVQYHYFFTAMLFVIGVLIGLLRDVKFLYTTFILFTIGILLFSGSLYLIAVSENILHVQFPRFIFLVTPLGGLCFLVGWILLVLGFARLKTNQL